MSYDSYEIPDGITPLVGYRGWLVKDDALWSAFPSIRTVEWPVGKPLHSECLPPQRYSQNDDRRVANAPKHYWAPHIKCTCGIYALHGYPKLWEQREGERKKTPKPWPGEAVTGMVHGWGHIIVGDKGFRAQYAKPIALISRPRSVKWASVIERLAERYGLEIVDAREVRK
jgi:hypothetical protein